MKRFGNLSISPKIWCGIHWAQALTLWRVFLDQSESTYYLYLTEDRRLRAPLPVNMMLNGLLLGICSKVTERSISPAPCSKKTVPRQTEMFTT